MNHDCDQQIQLVAVPAAQIAERDRVARRDKTWGYTQDEVNRMFADPDKGRTL